MCVPLLTLHAACLAVPWTGASGIALATCALLFGVRMLGLTAGYHRYFAHRAYATSRSFQLVLAVLGATAAQLGPLWWAGHHRRHHAHADTERDPHSPAVRGLWWAHIGWLLCPRYQETDVEAVREWLRYPELVFLDRHPLWAPGLLAAGLFATGSALETWLPAAGTSGAQLLVWGFFISTTALFHATLAVNSIGHRFGYPREDGADESRNNAVLAILALGDGWHANHHRHPSSARHGVRWYEVDATHAVLRALRACGLVWDLRGSDPSAPSPSSPKPSDQLAEDEEGVRRRARAARWHPAETRASPTRSFDAPASASGTARTLEPSNRLGINGSPRASSSESTSSSSDVVLGAMASNPTVASVKPPA